MTKEELKNKYSAFITEISEILGLGKPIDVLKLCATTDLFFQPLEKHIVELEKENEELKKEVEKYKLNNIFLEDCASYDKKISKGYCYGDIVVIEDCASYEWLKLKTLTKIGGMNVPLESISL